MRYRQKAAKNSLFRASLRKVMMCLLLGAGSSPARCQTPASAPVFTLQPSSYTVAAEHTVVFNVEAIGSPAPTYQWTYNGGPIYGETDSILMINGVAADDEGGYACVATNASGTATSATATLTVVTTSSPGYITNLSGRGAVGSGAANALIGGFVISGNSPKELLIRGIGPGLNTASGLTGYVSDPLLTLFNSSQTQIAQNDNWGGTAPLMAAEAAVGAFPVPANSLDAMLLISLPAVAAYTCQVTGVGGVTGIGLVEIYDADAAPPAARLVNISVRANVGTGANVLIGGFVIGGSTDETVLIRGVGPGLTYNSGLAGTLAQPVLNVYDNNRNLLYSNTVWGGDATLNTAAKIVCAFALQPTSQDSVVLVTLPPGAYTAEVSGVNGGTGIAMAEIYELY
jgi:hypothetical protein